MIEDKLTRNERIRLECLAQSNILAGRTGDSKFILETASKFEQFVIEGKEDNAAK